MAAHGATEPGHRLGLYTDGAFYVSIGWRAVASAIALPRQVFGQSGHSPVNAALPLVALNRVAGCLPDR
jgi:hypothetical protein